MECNVTTDTETGILPEGNQTCVNVYDVIEMCDPAAPPIMLQIRTRSLNPNPRTHPNPNPIFNRNRNKVFERKQNRTKMTPEYRRLAGVRVIFPG